MVMFKKIAHLTDFYPHLWNITIFYSGHFSKVRCVHCVKKEGRGPSWLLLLCSGALINSVNAIEKRKIRHSINLGFGQLYGFFFVLKIHKLAFWPSAQLVFSMQVVNISSWIFTKSLHIAQALIKLTYVGGRYTFIL